MEASTRAVKRWPLARWGIPLAAAAGVVLAGILSQPATTPHAPLEARQLVPISHVEAAAVAELSSPEFRLDLRNPDHAELFRHIRESGRPCPAGCLPAGLRNVPGIGCRNLEVEGKPGAIVCFRPGDAGVVHLVVFRADDVDADSLGAGDLSIDRRGDWTVARWAERGRVFLLLGHQDPQQLGQLF
jgi:hypothetical protein